MSPESVGVGVIGIGAWGWNHARILSDLPGTRLVAVCDVDGERTRRAGELFRADAYTKIEDLLARKDIDAVTICTPSFTHSQVALKAIDYGKDLLIEKPMATTFEECGKIVEEANEKGVLLTVGFVERFNQGVQTVKHLITDNQVGEIVSISCRRVSRWPTRIGDVGVVKDLAIHDIDISRYLAADEVSEVYAVAGSIGHSFEDHVSIVLRFRKGIAGFVEANWLTPRKVRKLLVTGSDGILSVDYISQEVTVENERGAFTPTVEWKEPLRNELEHFTECVAKRETPLVQGHDGAMAVKIAEATLASSRTGRPVQIP